jgi:tetratricopeptide (TPR) repeat protein
LIKEWPNSLLATASRSNLARLHVDLGEWDDAIQNLEMLKDSTGRVDMQAALLIADILASGKKDFNTAVARYNVLMNRITDSTQLALLMTRIGRAYFEGREYEKCREIMGELKRKYEKFYNTSPVPLNYIARSFAAEGEWELAENEFRWLISNYSGTEEAFNAHLLIADYYAGINEKRQVEAWYRRAEEFYDRMTRQHYGTVIEASALSYSAEIARREENWEKAADLLTQIFNRFPQTEIGRSALLKAVTIYRERLNKPELAEELMNQLKTELSPLSSGKNTE